MKSELNATVAKVRAVYGKRLTQADYSELESRKTVGDAAEYLKRNTYYSGVLANVDTASIHRGFLESLLNRAFYDRYEKLCRFQGLNEKPFYNFLLKRSEIRELLKALLFLNNDNEDVYIESMHAHLLKKAGFDLIELAKASDFSSVLKVIKHTPYYDVLKNIRPDADGHIPYTKCEVALRTYYHKWLLETAVKEFHGSTESALTDQIKVQTDVINLINAYRMKKFFGASAKEIREFMIPFHGRLSAEKQDQLYESETAEDYLRMLSKTSYGRHMEFIDENMSSEQFERELVKVRCAAAKRSLMFSDNAAVSIYSFMYLSEIELNNIISIIECIRYKKSVNYMENIIVTQ
ncbi:MAG: V0D/AC39 family V-type ATPase subunit [Porcipelethomonas sp.]